MRRPSLFTPNNKRLSLAAASFVPLGLLALLVLRLGGCTENSSTGSGVDRNPSSQVQPAGEEFLISVLDEVDAISNIASPPAPTGGRENSDGEIELRTILPSADHKLQISASALDTTFIYGEITSDGYGAVVTERHQYPKGLLLITVRKTHGKSPGKVVSQTRKYVSFADFRTDRAQQSNVTEVYGLSRDTIVTHVLRNGILETYTFRLPVVTRIVNPSDGSVRVTSRFGSAGAVVSEVRDGAGLRVQLRRNTGLTDGSIVSYTQFADSSWRNVRTVGRADGSVFRDVTSGR
ncbi:MAG: hypothetical protein E6K56_07735 [Ignavibacteria bacterium]|nr:MAG: hypothetical protein E6K56_07735 [Ignavibacteria bacterium]